MYTYVAVDGSILSIVQTCIIWGLDTCLGRRKARYDAQHIEETLTLPKDLQRWVVIGPQPPGCLNGADTQFNTVHAHAISSTTYTTLQYIHALQSIARHPSIIRRQIYSVLYPDQSLPPQPQPCTKNRLYAPPRRHDVYASSSSKQRVKRTTPTVHTASHPRAVDERVERALALERADEADARLHRVDRTRRRRRRWARRRRG